MEKIVKFRRRRKKGGKLPPEWQPYTVRKKKVTVWLGAIAAAMLGALIGIGSLHFGGQHAVETKMSQLLAAGPDVKRHFSLCHTGGGLNCVVDGDTIWMDGVKIRVADIDAPETHPSRCPYEADLGNRATVRLQELLNSGSVKDRSDGLRDADRYGRKLRTLWVNGHSVGATLISEGLARKWDGSRHPWC